MAITAANKIVNRDNTNAGIYNTASVDFVTNRLYLVGVTVHGAPLASSIALSGGGLTFTEIATVTWNTIASPNKRTSLYRCLPSGDVSTAVTIDPDQTSSHAHWTVDEFQGMDTTGTNGSGAIVQSVTNRADSGAGLTVTLSAFGSSSNAAFGFFGCAANQDIAEGSGFTALGEQTGDETPTTSSFSEWALNDTTVDVTFTSAASGGIAVEIKEAAGGGGATTLDPFGMSGFFGA